MTYALIKDPGYKILLTPTYDLDVRSAVIHGLAEYLKTLSWNHGQSADRFQVVEEYQAAFGDPSQYPAACCFPRSAGQYDDNGTIGNDVEDFGSYGLLYWGEFSVDLEVECFFTQPINRRRAMMAIESAAVPVEWLRGFRIQLPDYFNAVAEYSLTESNIEDNADDRTKGWYKSAYTFKANAPLYRRIDLPRMDPVAETAVGEDQ